tara:strand:+ start:5959 stop:6729 length:771 start_codon:yes stop_codon:yes gene_type:complete
MNYKITILLFLVPIFFISCSKKKNNNLKEDSTKNITVTETQEASLFNNNDEKQFYPIDSKIEDIESEIAILKEKVIQYESNKTVPSFNTEILKMIKTPKVKHEIQLSNGTTIQGTIIYENAEEMIVETQIGQLKIIKNEILKIEDILPPIAMVEFIGDGIEEIYKDYRAYKGSIKNMGLKRADFVRVIYSMYDENSNLIASDSSFVNGELINYNSGIISDASISQNNFADYYVSVEIPTGKIVKYYLRDIRWEYYE